MEVLCRTNPDLWGTWVGDHPGLPGQFRVVEDGTAKGYTFRKLSQRQAPPTQDRAAQYAKQRDGSARKLAADGPQVRMQLVDCDSLTSDGFVRPPTIEPISSTRPSFRHLKAWPAAFWKNHKESRTRTISRKETALAGEEG